MSTLKGKNPARPPKRRAPVKVTGGGGFRFENRVAARFLLDMLIGKNSLGADFGLVVRLDWQARDVGWLADDLAVSSRTASGEERTAGLSVKSYQQLGRAGFHPDFATVAWQQWLDHKTGRHFRCGLDAVVLATGKLADDVAQAWSDLHTEATLTTPGRVLARLEEDKEQGRQSSRLKRAIFESLRRPDAFGGEPRGDDTHDRVLLIRDVRVIKFGYEAHPSSDYKQALLDCQNCLSSGDAAEALNLWERLVGIADEERPAGGSLDVPGLFSILRGQFQFAARPDFRSDWETLIRRSADATTIITDTINGEAHLARDDQLTNVAKCFTSNRVCMLVGESGSGKSALAKRLSAERYSRAVWFFSDDLDYRAASDFERAIGLQHPLMAVLLSSPQPCLVVFDGIEGYTQNALGVAARMIRELSGNSVAQHLHVLLTVQSDAAAVSMRQLAQLGTSDATLTTLDLALPSRDELDTLFSGLPQLSWVALRPELRPLMTNLKVLDMTARTLYSEKSLGSRPLVGLTTLIDILWEDWIEHHEGGRSHVLKTIATEEADRLSNGVSRQSLGFTEQQALPGLTTSGLVRLKDERVAFAHDLIGDWARMRVLIGDGPITSSVNQQRTQSPRWHKAIRLFGQRVIEQSDNGIDQWRVFVDNVPDKPAAGALIRDLFLESLFLATNALTLIERAWPVLISNSGALLRRLLDRFLFVGTLPDIRLLALSADNEEVLELAHTLRVPYWPYWAPMLTVLRGHQDDVIADALYEAASVCALWLRKTPLEIASGQVMPWRKEAAELAVAVAREIQARNEEGSYCSSSGADRTAYEGLLYAARDLPTEVAALCLELAKRRDLSPTINARVQEARRNQREQQQQSQKAAHKARAPVMGFLRGRLNPPWPDGPSSRVDRDFQDACLDGTAFSNLAIARPDVAFEVLLAVCIEEPQHDDYGGSSLMEDTGLVYWRQADPPMYFRGPFLQFLRVSPEQGLMFVLHLVNFVTRRHVGDRDGETLEIDGKPKVWFGDNRVFRWHHDWPLAHGAVLCSVLMALERWFYEQIDSGQDVETTARRIVAESESVAFAGVLFDVGKKLPSLFAGALRPLFSSWVLWNWDFQISMLRANGHAGFLGFWEWQPQQIIKLAREWYAMPHRRDVLLALDGTIPRTMLSKPEFRPFFDQVRKGWKAALDAGADPEHLGPLIERINPDNYTFSSEGEPVDFQWPEAMARDHEQQLRQIGLDQAVTQFSFRCRKVLTAGKPLPDSQLLPLFEWLQGLETNPPDLPTQDGEPIQRLENVILGGIAVLAVLHLDWLLQDPHRIAWCRSKLEAIHANPPPPSRFDSEVAIGDDRWDDFAAECGIRLLVADKSDPLARKLVAQGVMGYHYGTTGLTMARAFAARAEIGDDFQRLVTLGVRWATLRVLSWISRDLGGDDQRSWDARKSALAAEFLSRELPSDLPDFKQLNAETLASYNALYEKRHPECQPRTWATKHGSTTGLLGGEREKLSPERLGFDERVLTNGLAWLDPGQAQSADERARCLALIHALLQASLGTVPVLDDPRNQEIEGLPSDFDGWVFEVVAKAVPQLTPEEKPESLWQAIFDLGAPAHDWVECFFWAWFTSGLRAARSPTEFARIWRSMIVHALASPRWQGDTYGSYRVDGMVMELLGTDGRWGSLAADSTFAPVLGTIVDVLAQAADRWFCMPRVVRSFLYFVVQPAAAQLLRPALLWVSKAMASYSPYDWRDGIEEGLVEYLNVCWRREQSAMLEDSYLKEAFFGLLASVVSRGSYAAIALRDRIAGSTAV
ncbi:MAG: hypothetical protein ACYCXT_13605 [Acidiferrobacteraceae bacterium]